MAKKVVFKNGEGKPTIGEEGLKYMDKKYCIANYIWLKSI